MNSSNILNSYNLKTIEKEDSPVLEFLSDLSKKMNYKYLEVGAGTGRFPLKIKNSSEFKNIDISCLEINDNLVQKLKENGLNTVQGSVLNMPFKDNAFDILHCSHVIEHFSYPDVVTFLEEMFRIVKKNGFVIIRSPLMHYGFYNDIDHVRPYPPKTIMQYFNNPQQQKTGSKNIQLVKDWYRREASSVGSNNNFKGAWHISLLLKILWIKFNWPRSKPNGYVAIFKKI